jgi:hypothetical protein
MEKGMKIEGKDHTKEEQARIDSPSVSLKAPLRPLKTTRKVLIGLVEKCNFSYGKCRTPSWPSRHCATYVDRRESPPSWRLYVTRHSCRHDSIQFAAELLTELLGIRLRWRFVNSSINTLLFLSGARRVS